jgi:predicted ester cyclase
VAAPGTDTASSAEQVARSYFERVTARDPDGMMDHWEAGGIGDIHGLVKLKAPDEYREWFSDMFAAFPDLRFEVIEVVAEGDKAAVRWSIDATFNGSTRFEGMEPTGSRVQLEGVDILTIRNGRIASLEAYLNGMEMARQVGALPAQGSAPERGMYALLNLKTRVVEALKRD